MTDRRSIRRLPYLTWCALALSALLAGSPAISDEQPRLPEPAPEELKVASERVEDAYEADIKAAVKNAEQAAALVKKMLQDAVATKDDPAGRYALLKLCADTAARVGDKATAMEAIRLVAAWYDVDELDLRSRTLIVWVKAVRQPKQQAESIDELLKVVDQCLRLDRFDTAKAVLVAANLVARRAKDDKLDRVVDIRKREVEICAVEFEESKWAREVLGEKPADEEANLEIGRYRCLIKGDWDAGLHYFVLGNDDTLRGLARAELSEPPNLKAAADEWWELAEEEEGITGRRMREHAAKLYETVLPGITGLARRTIEDRLRSLVSGDKPSEKERVAETRNLSRLFDTSAKPGDVSKTRPLGKLSPVSLAGTWKSIATGNVFKLEDRGTVIEVTPIHAPGFKSFKGSLVREGDRLTSTEWGGVLKVDAEKKHRTGECTGRITGLNRISVKFTKWNFYKDGKFAGPSTGHSHWVRKKPED